MICLDFWNPLIICSHKISFLFEILNLFYFFLIFLGKIVLFTIGSPYETGPNFHAQRAGRHTFYAHGK